MDTDEDSSTDSFIELINMQTSTIVVKDKKPKNNICNTIFSVIQDCIAPICRYFSDHNKQL